MSIASENRYKRIVDAITDFIYTVEVQNGLPGKIRNISNCTKITGYTPDEYEANPNLFREIVHGEDIYISDKQIADLISRGVWGPVEHRIIHKDGTIRWVKKILVPDYNEDGVLIAYDSLINDITRQKETESRLLQSEKMASLGVLSAGIAHEIKNPLSIVLKGIELLEISPFKDSINNVLFMMKDAVFRASRITKDMLTFSRENSPELKEVDLLQVIDETLSIVNHILKFKNIEIIKNFSGDLPKVKSDSNQMKQVFINLLTNATESMPQGGTITITAGRLNIHNEKLVQIAIADTGSGIAEGEAQRIFDPFYTTKKSSGGTGLGLSVVKGIIEKHKGSIRIESKVGRGTTIIFELPYSENN